MYQLQMCVSANISQYPRYLTVLRYEDATRVFVSYCASDSHPFTHPSPF